MLRAHPFVLLDDARPGSERQTLFCKPERIVSANRADEIGAALQELGQSVASGCHAAGYFSYELGYALESKLTELMPLKRSVPLLWFGLFRQEQALEPGEFDRWLAENIEGRAYAGPLRFAETEKSYAAKFAAVQGYIHAGDVYQINLTFPGRFAFEGDPLALYARLRAAKAGHGAYVYDGTRDVLSFSPELFFSTKDGRVTARPMKGTAPRGRDSAADVSAKAELHASAKDRAENLMIVDLIRNDFGRLARTGSVRTRDLFTVETYPTLHQMVSTVEAELRRGVTIEDIIRAVFPCGSITGAPKIRAMELIRDLEQGPRGIYCGAIGRFSPDGSAAFNVAIRTLTIEGNEGVLGVGSGVVADSEREAEYQECLLKARYFTEGRRPIALIETLRFAPGAGFLRGDRHLSRLRRSAARLGLPFDEAAIREAMNTAVAGHKGPLRVRLRLDDGGGLDIETKPFDLPDGGAVWKYVISETRVSSRDRLARCKTDWRALYDGERAEWSKHGVDEILYLNEKDELAEGGISNVFVQLDGVLVTPPLACGALDGCLRRSLLDQGTCIEKTLTAADLARAEALYFGNSLRGLIRGELHEA